MKDMYETFLLRQTPKGNIEGQHWPAEDPSHVVCIVHGIGEYGGRYDRVATEFNKAGYAVIAMDLRGHGHSMNRWGHCAPRKNVLDDVSALITYAQLTYKDVPIILYGHSMGGNIGLDYRCRGGMNDVPSAYIITAPWIDGTVLPDERNVEDQTFADRQFSGRRIEAGQSGKRAPV